MAGKDLDGGKQVRLALTEIKGIGWTMAHAVARAAKVDMFKKIGALDDGEMKRLTDVLKNPSAHGIPAWALNRRKDIETGEDKHLIGGEIDMALRFDIARERRIRSYRGIRHERGLRVRGQRTRTTGRKGITVGVKRKETRMREEAAKKSKKKG